MELYTTVFRLLCDWEKSGGEYWVIQEELLRHATIYEYRCKSTFFKVVITNTFSCELNKKLSPEITEIGLHRVLNELLPFCPPSYINHKIVLQRMKVLREEFMELITFCTSSDKPEVR